MAITSPPTGPTAGARKARTGWSSSSNELEAAREGMQPLNAGFGDENHLTGLHTGFSVARHHVRLNDDRLSRPERVRGHRPCRAAFAAENRRKVTAAVAVEQIIDDREPGLFNDARGFDHLLRHRAGSQHRRYPVERSIRRRMQVAIEPVRLSQRKAAQNLAGI